MSDVEQRQHQRRFRSCGDPDASGAWCRSQLRSGATTHPKLRLAAGLGHLPAALALVGPLHPKHVVSIQRSPPKTSLSPLRRYGWEAMARAACALFGSTCAGHPDLGEALELARTHTLQPTVRSQERVFELRDLLGGDSALDRRSRDLAGGALRTLALTNRSRMLNALCDLGRTLVPQPYPVLFDRVDPEVFGLVRADLLPWALGLGDPLRERSSA